MERSESLTGPARHREPKLFTDGSTLRQCRREEVYVWIGPRCCSALVEQSYATAAPSGSEREQRHKTIPGQDVSELHAAAGTRGFQLVDSLHLQWLS